MADITFKFKRGSSGGSSPSGLTHGELAVNTTDNRLFVGSVTGSVNAVNNRFFTGISTPSYPIEGDRWYTGTEEKFYYNGNWVTAGGASGSSGSSFDPTQLLVFNSGVSGSGGATFAGGTRFYGGAIVQSGGLSVTGGATITGGVALYGTITVNGAPISSGIANVPLASSSATGVASFGNEFTVSTAGAVGLTSNYVISVNGRTGSVTGIAITGSNTFLGLQTLNAGLTTNYLYVSNGATFADTSVHTGLGTFNAGITSSHLYVTSGATFTGTVSATLNTVAQPNITSVGTLTKLDVGSGGISSAGGITGTLNTAAQPNITSVGTLTKLDVGSGGISSAGGITGTLNTAAQPNITSVGTLTSLSSSGLGTFNAGITSNHLYVTNGVTFAGTSVHTGLGTFNAGITSNHFYVSNGVTFASTSVHTGLGTFNAGITSSHLYVTSGATFASGLVVQAGGISITGGATLTGGVAVYGGLNVSSGTISGTLATAAQPNITSVGTLTKLEVGSGGISSAGGITGTLNTAAQPNITSVGTLTSLSSSGLVTASGGITSNHLYVTNGVTFANTSVHTGLGTFNAGITSSHLYVTNGATFASTSVHTGLGTFNAGITSSHLYVTNGATFAGTSVHTGLGTFNAGLTTTHLYVTNGATFASTSVHTGLGTFNAGITSNHFYVSNGVTFASTSVHTGLGTFNAGITSNHFYVSNGATFANGLTILGVGGYQSISSDASNNLNVNSWNYQSYKVGGTEKLYIGAAGISATGLYVSTGATFANGLSVIGGTASFKAMSVGTLTGAYFMAEQGFTAGLIYVPNTPFKQSTSNFLQQGIAFKNDTNDTSSMYRWGNSNFLSRDYGYGYASSIGGGVAIVPPPTTFINNRPTKITDVVFYNNSFGHLCLLSDKSLTGWGAIAGLPNFPPIGNFIDLASGLSSQGRPTNLSPNNEIAGWWLGLMENGRLTGSAWNNSLGQRYHTTLTIPTVIHDPTNPIFSKMPASLRWDASSGITAKAILGSDDAYCYALLSDGSLTAWGATCFSLGGSGDATSWTTGGTGGFLSNFPSSGITFTQFASTRASKTIGFAIKPDGNLLCFGYTGTSPAVVIGASTTGNIAGAVDYRHVFCTNRTGNDQIVKVDIYNEYYQSTNAVVGGAGSPGWFFSKPFATNGGDTTHVFVGLTKAGSLTAGIFAVNYPSLYMPQSIPFTSAWASYNELKNSGVTFSDIACGMALIVAKRSDGGLNALGTTSGVVGFGSFNQQQTLVPTAFAQGSQTIVRFGGPVNISNAPLGQSDPYTQLPILDVRGGIIAGQIAIASDSSTKSSIAMEQTNDGVVSFWKKDLLENLAPQEFNYLGDTSPTTIGYFAENAEAANPNYVTRINPVNINADVPPNSTSEITTPYSAINLNTLMVGTIESLRELDTEMSRIWTTESVPYPSKVKNGDLWYYSSENRLYIRKHETWIQIN